MRPRTRARSADRAPSARASGRPGRASRRARLIRLHPHFHANGESACRDLGQSPRVPGIGRIACGCRGGAAAVAASRTMEYRPEALGPTGRPVPVFPDPEPLLEHGPARVVAVCNQKGGVGKTTTTISLGAALAEVGRRVLLVDFDPQGALSVGLGFQPHELDSTVYNLLMERGTAARDVLFKTNVDGMDLLPSNIDLSGAEVQLVHEVCREFVLRP